MSIWHFQRWTTHFSRFTLSVDDHALALADHKSFTGEKRHVIVYKKLPVSDQADQAPSSSAKNSAGAFTVRIGIYLDSDLPKCVIRCLPDATRA